MTEIDPQSSSRRVRRRRGQAPAQSMVEYALIVVLVIMGIITVLTATGPYIGNVFSNQVYNLLGQRLQDQLSPAPLDSTVVQMATNIASTIEPRFPTLDYHTNTPLIPTCSAGSSWNQTWAPTKPGTTGGTYVWPCP